MKHADRSMGRVRIAVLGKFNVGKSALTVRYLTRRFIGEYRSNEDLLYRQAVVVSGSLTDVEIYDVSGETRDTMTVEEAAHLAADGAVVVYSIVDRSSFEYARRLLGLLGAAPGLHVTLLANKADLAHLREVPESEGRALAEAAGSPFYEVSSAEDSAGLYQAFELLVAECHAQLSSNNNHNAANNNNNAVVVSGDRQQQGQQQGQGGQVPPRTRKFSVTKMLGTLIGAAKSSSPPPAGSTAAPAASLQGTVVVCHKSELFRRGVLRSRRHKTSITASL
ncbi:Ras-related and estrogen-regulated growth inhibitor-like protein [Frankliniella fusca]|uniref:small monomeric GTPase n=1 Tax=Frankliniella fusca TaxID=407009 RepID=A0AAE1LMG2_9NEOP|nr:Ras-related and estrogen-regulated growth inhibitor-like protein [Frankliniella fusca]